MTQVIAIDWTGSPDGPDSHDRFELYGPAAVRYAAHAETNDLFDRWRKEFSIPDGFEFKGHSLRKRADVLMAIAEWLTENAVITAALFDKRLLMKQVGPSVFSKPEYLVSATALLLLSYTFERSGEATIVYDKGDIGDNRRRLFETRVRQLATERSASVQRIKALPSHKSHGVQLADVIAYLLSRHAAGLLQPAELARFVTNARRKEGNDVRIISGVDLQPYL